MRRRRHWSRSLRARAISLGVIPLAFLLFVLASVAVLQREVQIQADWLIHSGDVLNKLKDFNQAASAASGAASTYIFVGDSKQLPVYAQSKARALREIVALQSLVQDNPAQTSRAAAIRRAALKAFAQLSSFMELARRHDRTALNAAIAASIRTADRKHSIAALETQFQDAEETLKAQREAERAARWRQLDALLIAATIAGIALTVWLTANFGRRIVLRLEHLRRSARRFAKTGTVDIAVDGDDEISDLQNAYVDMAAEVHERERQLVRYRLLSEHTRDIMLFVRRDDGRILEANRAACDAYGYTNDELTSMSALELRAPEVRDLVGEQLAGTGQSGALFETLHRRKDGTIFPVEVAARATQIGGEEVVLSVIRDISERRRDQERIALALDQAIEASRLKSEFVATMSHEIRTPMNGVIGMTDLLLRTPLSPEQAQYCTIVRESGEALLGVINDILDFSKIEAGRMELETSEFDLTALVEGVAAVLMPQAHDKRLSLMTFVEPTLTGRLRGDAGRLRQVLLNLAGNAVKFTDQGSVLLSATRGFSGGKTVRIDFSVQDTGAGIAPDLRATLFQPFRQGDGTTSRKHGGTGLGLSISQRLVELMGGRITVDARDTGGSTFNFSLMLDRAASDGVPLRELTGTRALVVDDDPVSCNILSDYLRSWGIAFDQLNDPRTVVDRLIAQAAHGTPYDVVLLDLSMPYLDGFDVARAIRTNAELDAVRLILITAYDQPGQAARAIESGFSAYLTKPVRQSQLFDTILNASVPGISDAAAIAPVPPVQSDSMRILVAEDNAINRDLAVRQLAALGYTADCVVNGAQAVSAAATGEYDVILMDCQMPELDGFEATKAIRKYEARTGRRSRIIAMTANALASDREACFEAGMDDYIAKPVILDRLQAALTNAPAAPARSSGNPIPLDSPAVLDEERVRLLLGGDNHDRRAFLRSAADSLQQLVEQLQDADSKEVRRLAHEIKGAAGNLGARELSVAAAQLENDDGDEPARTVRVAAVRVAASRLSDTVYKPDEGVSA